MEPRGLHGLTPLRSSAFRRLWCSTLTLSGAQLMERTATGWLALQTGDAFTVGLVFAARSLPSLLFGLAAGTVADRVDRRRQMLAVAGLAALLLAGLSRLVAAGAIGGWHVVLISLVAGCAQVFDTPARQALVIDSVPRELAPNAMALNALAQRLAGAAGALGGGLLIPLLGLGNCYLVIALGYGLTALLSTTLPAPRRARAALAHAPFSHALRDAARLIVQLPAVRTLTISGVACEIFAFSYSSALPVFTTDVLAIGAAGLGLLNAAASLGGTVGLLLLSLVVGRLRREPLLAAVFLGYGASLVLLGTVRELWLAVAVLVLTGLCAAAFDMLQQTLLQLAVPEEQRGRAVGIWVLGVGSAPVGNLEMGTLAGLLGAPGGLLVNGALTVAAAALLLARAPHYRAALRQAPEPRTRVG
ncbi:MAG TPA: MFS transporter [Thermomicrobiaceae bacterium]|nr:MFS transporter [Thermomicrobiaceae bacterium]